MAEFPNNRPPSIRDVAELAGVSPSTVSLVINGKVEGRVSEHNQEAVKRAIVKVGYRADPVARGMATGRRSTVAVVVPDLESAFFDYVTMGIATELTEDLQMLLAFERRGAGIDSVLDRMLAMRVSGLLYVGPSAHVLRQRRDIGCPTVIMDDDPDSGSIPTVGFDLEGGAGELAEHLLSLGHRRVAYISPEVDSPTFRHRRDSLKASIRRHSRSRAAFQEACAGTSIQAGAACVSSHWEEWNRLGATALVCATDTQAYGALMALRQLGVEVPGRISVASFDDLPFSRVTTPQLTAVSLSPYDLGREAVRLLLPDSEPAPAASVLLPARLVVRESTGAAPA